MGNVKPDLTQERNMHKTANSKNSKLGDRESDLNCFDPILSSVFCQKPTKLYNVYNRHEHAYWQK